MIVAPNYLGKNVVNYLPFINLRSSLSFSPPRVEFPLIAEDRVVPLYDVQHHWNNLIDC